MNGFTRLLRSILVLLLSLQVWKWPRSSSTRAVGYFFTGFAGIGAPRAVFRTIAFTQNGEVCTVFLPENLDIISTNPCFAVFSAVRSLR